MRLQPTPKTYLAASNEPTEPREERRKLQIDLPASLSRDRVLDSEQAASFLGISLPHFRRLYRAKRVPAPIMIGYRKYGWQAGILIDFVASKTGQAA